LADSLEFSVGKCTVQDKNIAQSLDILDTCPIDGTNFAFIDTQSDTTAVEFTFDGFVFPTSADDTTIDVSCAVNVCPANSLECLKLCDEDSGIDGGVEETTHIWVILQTKGELLSTNEAGSETSAVQINLPFAWIADGAKSAVVQGKLHFFGGFEDSKRIAILDACNYEVLPYKLNLNYASGHAALSISDDSEALICFDSTNSISCEVFTGSSVFSTYSTSYRHFQGGLGFYNGQPITVGGIHPDGHRKIETLSSTGWTSLADSPKNYYGHMLVGIGNDLLMIGGRDPDANYAIQRDVWRLRDNNWSQEPDLKQKVYYGSAIASGNIIFIAGGLDESATSFYQRIHLEENNEIASVEEIGILDQYYGAPPLFATSEDICVSN